MKKVFVVGGSDGLIAGMFIARGFELTSNPFTADLYQFTGGEDVTPEIYGHKNTNSGNSFLRDVEEMGFYALAKRLGIPMVGICRGGQFLNVMCGGTMLQDVVGHTRSHEIITATTKLQATSTHHQMMQLGPRGLLVAWAELYRAEGRPDPEVVFYEHDKCLCFQPHPEYVGHKGLQDYYFDLIKQLLLEV